MSLLNAVIYAEIDGENLSPEIQTSQNYKHWVSFPDLKRCIKCEENHGKIWLISEIPEPKPPIHPYCRCEIELMQAIKAGTATIKGINGADWTLKYKGELPDFYITIKELKFLGWSRGKAISKFVTDKPLTKGIYKNKNGHLPQVSGRIWYEADINYIAGPRNSQRILWSNDGLIFVTYDHYETFYEIF